MVQDPDTMYRWRRMTEEQRKSVLNDRLQHARPAHSVPHIASDTTTYYLLSAACFEHKSIIGKSPARMRQFEDALVTLVTQQCNQVFAWCVLPNHYHVVVDTVDIKRLLKELGKLHGRHSFFWNGEDDQRGRQVWCNAAETAMKSEGHFYATLNYVLNNAVHHHYVAKWTDWPYCNAQQYIETVGRAKALATWKSYPVFDYGKDWDPPDT
jgi:putative transposase